MRLGEPWVSARPREDLVEPAASCEGTDSWSSEPLAEFRFMKAWGWSQPSRWFMIILAVMFFARLRSVVTIPKLSFRASASEVTLFVPPAFLDTTTASFQLGMFRRIHRAIRGSAWRLSTGHLKNPCICEAWRSTVMTCLTPATWSKLASIRAVMAPRCDFFLD